MPLVNVLLNGRAYTVACDEGEEDHVRALGEFLDKRVRELSGSVGQVGDARLLLMAGLVVADELNEALADLDERDRKIVALKEQLGATQPGAETQNEIADVLDSASARIEAIAAKLAAA
jgi:cell division protein ZapA